MSAKKAPGKRACARFEGFTAEERAAMKERAQELKAIARRGPRAEKADEESAILAQIAEMSELDRAMAERLHAIIKATAPDLSPRLWYGMPAHAKDGKVVCFFQSAQKFKTRYTTFGFSDKANFDEGAMWPTTFAERIGDYVAVYYDRQRECPEMDVAGRFLIANARRA